MYVIVLKLSSIPFTSIHIHITGQFKKTQRQWISTLSPFIQIINY